MKLNFDYFYDFAKKEFNLDLSAYKDRQLQRRITTLMKNTGVDKLEKYAELLSKDSSLSSRFLDYITINVTEFFRNKEIFDEFEKILINNLLPEFKNLRIWSAACSTGAEPYSLAIILDRYNIKNNEKIIATDIDENILNKAKEGVFRDNEIRNVDKALLKKYFSKKDNLYYINDNIKNMVTFKKHDLILDDYEKGFHAIVCRNVTIYLKKEIQDEMYKKFNESLVKGGILFTGATETIFNPTAFGFEKISAFIYQKV